MTLCDTCDTPLFPSGCLQCAADFEDKPLILVDADIVTFQASATCESTVSFGETECLVQEPDVAFFKCNKLIRDIQENLQSTHVLLCFSCPSKENFRRKVLPTYKHNRTNAWKPKLLGPLREMLEEEYPSISAPRLEADDVIGVLTKVGRTVIATIDKDMDQLPGLHFNWKHQEVYDVERPMANYFRWLQVLMGDAVDGYTGIPKVGPKKAEKILDGLNPFEYKQACEKAYADREIPEADYHAQVAVAQILRPSQFDWETGEIKTTYITL